jgi:hypothetical protein
MAPLRDGHCYTGVLPGAATDLGSRALLYRRHAWRLYGTRIVVHAPFFAPLRG